MLVEAGTFVLDLNWDIEPGMNYGLRCTTEDPQLWREGNNSQLSYPYEVGDLLTITNSTAGPSLDYYYFFYEWKAEPKPIECVSDRVGVTVTVAGTVDVEEGAEALWSVTPILLHMATNFACRASTWARSFKLWMPKVGRCTRARGKEA